MLGVGGVLAEAVADVAFRLVPLTDVDADEHDRRPRAPRRCSGPFRGEPAVDRRRSGRRAARAVGVGRGRRPDVVSVDVNPLIVVDGRPVAVDALVELGDRSPHAATTPRPTVATDRAFRALFEPRGVIVAGASTPSGQVRVRRAAQHPRGGLRGPGRSRPTSRATPVLGVETVRRHRRPARRRGRPRVRVHAGRGQPRAAARVRGQGHPGRVPHLRRLRRGGRRGRAGRRHELVALADELGILLAGPERPGRGVDAGAACARRSSRRTRRPGRIGIASQSGNFVSSFLNCAGADRRRRQPGRVSAGNAAAVGVADYLDFYADDPATAVGLAYVEGVADGRALRSSGSRAVAERKPVVLVKGGATAGGQRAAASHTGSLATDDRVFDGVCRQAGVTRAATVEEAFEAAATFATQPLPAGPANVVVLTTAGGWGVVTADAITPDGDLELAAAARRPAAPRSTRSCRRAGAATTRSTSPAARPATRSPRCWSSIAAPSRRRRDRLPRARHPVEPGAR